MPIGLETMGNDLRFLEFDRRCLVTNCDWFSGLQRLIAAWRLSIYFNIQPSQDCVQLRCKSAGAFLRAKPEMT